MGKYLVVTCFGESHGRCVGIIIDGCPPGLEMTGEDVQKEVNKRRPISNQISTSRGEEDKVEVLSGVFRGHTTGAPICMLVWNKNVESEVYEQFRWKPRPGHADYPALERYGEFNDYRGGGRFSGRITVAFTMAGAVAKKLLKRINVEVLAHTVEVAGVGLRRKPSLEKIRNNVYENNMRCADQGIAKMMEKAVVDARNEGDSVGGVVESVVLNVPPGIGDPIFDSLDADMAKALFNIPGVKGVEFGMGFNVARIKGSENNDQYAIKNGKVITLTNNSGGVLGGLSTGMPLIVRTAFKPVSSIQKKQQTVDLRKVKTSSIKIKGRHDACIVPRAVPVVESVVAIVLADHLLRRNYFKSN